MLTLDIVLCLGRAWTFELIPQDSSSSQRNEINTPHITSTWIPHVSLITRPFSQFINVTLCCLNSPKTPGGLGRQSGTGGTTYGNRWCEASDHPPKYQVAHAFDEATREQQAKSCHGSN